MFLGSSNIQSLLGEIPSDISIICIPQYLDKVTPGALVIVEDICTMTEIATVIKQGGTIVSVEKAREEIACSTRPLFNISFDLGAVTTTNKDITAPLNVDQSTPEIQKLEADANKTKTVQPLYCEKPSLISEKQITLRPAGLRGIIIASKSTKGGVGKSTTGINAAAYYAGQGKNTCMVDLDIGKGNAAAMLHLKGRTGPSVENWRSFERLGTVRHSSGFYFIPWGNDPGFVVNESDVSELICQAAEEFEIVVLDYGVNPYLALAGLEMADKIYLIANQSESMLVEFVETFINVFPELVAKSELVINRVTPSGYYKPSEVAGKTGFTSFHVIPESAESNKVSEKTGKAFVQIPGSDAGEAYIRMLGGEVKAKKKSLFGFLRR